MARTVLLADDSVTAQNMGRRILTDAGYEVITVNNGSAALKKVHESRPDIIVLDVYMPGYGGLEVCQRLKESGDTMRIPVLLTVGKMEPFKSDEAKRVKADGHIVKPFEASELLAALTKLEDKIVPGVDARARKGKSDKKSPRSWHAGEEPASAPSEWTDRVAYLTEAKQRRVDQEPEAAPETTEIVAPAPRKAVAPVEPAPEMLVVAEAAPDDNARFANARVDVDEKSQAGAEPAIQANDKSEGTTPVAISAGANQESAEQTIETKASPVPEETVAVEAAPVRAVAKPRWVAENVALTAEEASLKLDREMQQSQGQISVTEAPVANSEEVPAAPPAEVAHESHERNSATFAAAASATASSSAVASVAPQVPNEEEAGPAGLDATAAWNNWQQIRDSVMSARNSGDIEAAISAITNAGAAASTPEMPASAPTSEINDDHSAQPIQGEALASIVDTVLAELKPKLMEQIAKKLAAEKK